MAIIRRAFYHPYFVHDKFDKKYPFDLKNQVNGYHKTFGEKNPDKTFYVIWRDFLGAGFFSNFTQVASHLRIAHHLGMIPVVDYKNFKTLYNEKELINGSENAWEYYFDQVSPYSLEEVYESKRVFFCHGGGPTQAMLAGYENEESYKDFFEKNFRFKDNVRRELEKYSHLTEGRVLGVHFRGKELNIAQLHPYGPTVKQMFRSVDEILEKYQIEKILMVTEEQNYLDAFIARYGSKVVFSDSFRIAKVNAYNLLNARPNHRYLLGLEALVDSMLLSKCTGLLHGASGLSGHSARIGNHEFTYLIDNGLNFRKWYFAKYSYRIRKLLPAGFGGLKGRVVVNGK